MAGPLGGLFRPSSVCAHARKRGRKGANLHRHPFVAADGTVVHARTLEFGVDLMLEIIIVPRGYARTGTTPDGKEGLRWTPKYATIGMNGAGLPVLFDGLNEKRAGRRNVLFPQFRRLHAVYPGRLEKSHRPIGGRVRRPICEII
jgi:hypothetical protein